MTSLEDELRDTLRSHESDITETRVGQRYKTASAHTTRGMQRFVVPFLATASVAGVILIATFAVSPANQDPTQSTEIPTAGADTPPPADPGPYRLWLSEPVVPEQGAEVAAVLLGPAGASAPPVTFGVAAVVDRWDGSQWQPHRHTELCLDFWNCVGSLLPLEDELGVRDIGLFPSPEGVGPVELLWVDHLDPGWYRLRQTANEGLEAAGVFQVVAGDAPTVPLGPRDVDRLLVAPPLVSSAGGTLSVSRLPLSRDEEPADSEANEVGEQLELEAWADGEWEPLGMLHVSPVPAADAYGWEQVRVPAVSPGAYRLVERVQSVEAQAVFWVVDDAALPEATAAIP